MPSSAEFEKVNCVDRCLKWRLFGHYMVKMFLNRELTPRHCLERCDTNRSERHLIKIFVFSIRLRRIKNGGDL